MGSERPVLREEGSLDLHSEDTIRGGDLLADPDAAEGFVAEAPGRVRAPGAPGLPVEGAGSTARAPPDGRLPANSADVTWVSATADTTPRTRATANGPVLWTVVSRKRPGGEAAGADLDAEPPERPQLPLEGCGPPIVCG